MEYDFALCLVGCFMAAAGPVLLVVFWRSFTEGSGVHPIYDEGDNISRAAPAKIDSAAKSPMAKIDSQAKTPVAKIDPATKPPMARARA